MRSSFSRESNYASQHYAPVPFQRLRYVLSLRNDHHMMRRCGTQSIHPTYGCTGTARKKAEEQKTYHIRKEPSSHEYPLLRPRLHRGLERLVTEEQRRGSPGRQQSAHCPVTSSTSPPPDTFTTHALMINPLQHNQQ